MHPLLTLIPVTETRNRPAVIFGISSDRIGTPEGTSVYLTASKDLEHWTGLPDQRPTAASSTAHTTTSFGRSAV